MRDFGLELLTIMPRPYSQRDPTIPAEFRNHVAHLRGRSNPQQMRGSFRVVSADPNAAGTAKDVEDFLMRLNNKASQGLPVGPAASIVFSEALCTDIDQFISNDGFTHTRYVDDIRVFASSEGELAALLERIVEYLYNQHRLQLSWSKTSVMATADYRMRYLETPEQVEKTELLGVVRALSDYPEVEHTDSDPDALAEEYLSPDAADDAPPAAPPTDGPPADDQADVFNFAEMFAKMEAAHRLQVRGELFEKLLTRACAEPVDIGLARRVLRRARVLRVSWLFRPVLQRISELGAVAPDAFVYLDSLATPELIAKHLDLVHALTQDPRVQGKRFLKHWLDWYISGHRSHISDPAVSRYIQSTASIEHRARAATISSNHTWVRSQKAQLAQMGPRDRRAVIWASRILPSAERRPWLSAVLGGSDDRLERWVIDYVSGLP